MNAQGVRRDAPVPPRAAGGRLRIATYGDREVFGWGVDEAESFQRLMEAGDSRLEVINLGVPGYDASCVAEHVERTAPRLAPDLVVYVVNPNDFEPPLPYVNRWTWSSEAVRRVAYELHKRGGERDYENLRRAPESTLRVRTSIRRIVDAADRVGASCWIAFLDAGDRFVVDESPTLARRFEAGGSDRLIDLSRVTSPFQKVDLHFPAAAHEAIARTFASELRSWTPAARVAAASPR